MKFDSKQIVSAISVVLLLIILIYPALSTGAVSLVIQSTRIEKADHVYVRIDAVLAHQKGQASNAGWKAILNHSQTFDLASLVNSSGPLGSGQVAVASYDAIRIQFSNVTWVFNKTSNQLPSASPQLDTNLEFNTMAGKQLVITLVLGGQQQVVGSSRFFAGTLNATLTT